jgi:hypothetical protein
VFRQSLPSDLIPRPERALRGALEPRLNVEVAPIWWTPDSAPLRATEFVGVKESASEFYF